ncbi:MAG: pseudouridine synthase [Candidatus Sumerlaeota bacterium]|nr:pseudouridine synthase [Candidatus Sumerlaeota bacterium]
MATERINKYLARCGVASRRGADEMIAKGRVRINGKPVAEAGAKVDMERDRVAVDGKPVRPQERTRVIIFYKPRGIVTTVEDPKTDKTLQPWLSKYPERLYPVGRLDRDSEGLLLLTNDGTLTHHLTHPRYHIEKEYRVTVRGRLTAEQADRMAGGIKLEDGPTQPTQISAIDIEPDRSRFNIILREGRQHQIRRMCEAVGLHVIRLRRLRIGPLNASGMKPGEVRDLTPHELRALEAEFRKALKKDQSSAAKHGGKALKQDQPSAAKRVYKSSRQDRPPASKRDRTAPRQDQPPAANRGRGRLPKRTEE